MEQDYRLAEGEYRFACLVWANEPLGSGQLVALANEALGWKKSTTYTVLKKLCERGILHNANGTVTALVKQAQVQQEESAAVVQKSFGGSLPRWTAPHLLDSMIYYLTSGVFCYAKRSTKQTIYARIQKTGN